MPIRSIHRTQVTNYKSIPTGSDRNIFKNYPHPYSFLTNFLATNNSLFQRGNTLGTLC